MMAGKNRMITVFYEFRKKQNFDFGYRPRGESIVQWQKEKFTR
jgi:hypothetical protein